jgi:hypothetical protein
MVSRHRLIFLGVLALAVAAFSATPAVAGGPCWQRVIDDWADNSRIDGTYPVKCYQDALAKLPEDMRAYSSAPEDIERAMRAVIVGSGEPPDSGGSGSSGPFGQALDEIGPDDSSSFPLPLLILGVIAGVLVGAGGVGFLASRLNANRTRSGER